MHFVTGTPPYIPGTAKAACLSGASGSPVPLRLWYGRTAGKAPDTPVPCPSSEGSAACPLPPPEADTRASRPDVSRTDSASRHR